MISSLGDAWRWYSSVKISLSLTKRLGERHGAAVDWGAVGNDPYFVALDATVAADSARSALRELDDLCVLLLFSVFEAVVREQIAREVSEAAGSITQPLLVHAAAEVMEAAKSGSFFRLLDPYKPADADLVEQVNQVRRYRNWVAHGRRGKPPASVTPPVAFERLTAFVAAINPPSGSLPPLVIG